MFAFWSFALYLVFCFLIGLSLSYFDITNRLLNGLNFYVLSDEASKAKAVIHENDSQGRSGTAQKKKKNANWDGFVEQIGRAKIHPGFIMTRIFCKEYSECMTFVLMGLSSFSIYSLYLFLPQSRYGLLDQGNSVTLLLGLIAIWRLIKSMLVIEWHTGTTNRIDRLAFCVAGLLTFVCVYLVLVFFPHHLDFDWEKGVSNAGEILASHLNTRLAEGQKIYDPVPIKSAVIKCLLATFSGLIAFLLFPSALRVGRSYHISTFPTSWDIGVLQREWFVRLFLHSGLVAAVVASILWINPLMNLFIVQCSNSDITTCDHTEDRFDWSKTRGISRESLESIRIFMLLYSAIVQAFSLRVHVQGYLNSALGVWYENMHGITEMSVDEIKHNLQRINFFVCKVAMQCVIPGAIPILFLGLTFSRGKHFDDKALKEGHLIPPLLFRQFFTFMAWICTFMWVSIIFPILALFRLGQIKAY